MSFRATEHDVCLIAMREQKEISEVMKLLVISKNTVKSSNNII